MEQEQSISAKKRKLAKLEDLTEKLEKDKISSKELELLQRLVGNDQNSNMTYQVTQSLPKSITDPIVVSLPHSIPVQTIQITNQIKSSNKNTLHSQLSEPKSNGNSCPAKPKITKSSAEQPSEDDFKPNRTLKAKVEEDEDIEEKDADPTWKRAAIMLWK